MLRQRARCIVISNKLGSGDKHANDMCNDRQKCRGLIEELCPLSRVAEVERYEVPALAL